MFSALCHMWQKPLLVHCSSAEHDSDSGKETTKRTERRRKAAGWSQKMRRKCYWDIEKRRIHKLASKCQNRKVLLFLLLLLNLSGSLVLSIYFIQMQSLFSGPCSIFWPASLVNSAVWTIVPNGRLGNQMGEYAALYALAKLNGRTAYIAPEMHNLLSPIFNISLPVLPRRNYTEICWREYELHDWMSEEYKSISGKYVKFTGYPCSWTFYRHIRDEIHKEFSFHNSVKEEVNDYLEKLKGPQKNVTYIGVHVRRGDYIEVMHKTWKGVVADEAYLSKAMTYFRNKYHHPIFVVASNGIQWCKDNIDTSKGDVYFSGDGKELSPWTDFALLAHCNHTIMTIGTFGYWVGYLAGGETVYLTNFTLPDSPFLKVFRYDAAYLPHWVGIPANITPFVVNEPHY